MVSWERRSLIWALKGGRTVLPLARSERLLGPLGQKEDVERAPGLRRAWQLGWLRSSWASARAVSQHVGSEPVGRFSIPEPAGRSGPARWPGGPSVRMSRFPFDKWALTAGGRVRFTRWCWCVRPAALPCLTLGRDRLHGQIVVVTCSQRPQRGPGSGPRTGTCDGHM